MAPPRRARPCATRSRTTGAASRVRGPEGSRGALPRGHVGLPAPQPLQELSERGRPDDRVELTPVARDEAHAVGDDVVHPPSPVTLQQSVVDREFLAPIGNDSGPDFRVLAADTLALEGDRRKGKLLIGGQVGSLEHLDESLDELRLLLEDRSFQCWAERPARHLVEVEQVLGDSAGIRPAAVCSGASSPAVETGRPPSRGSRNL